MSQIAIRGWIKLPSRKFFTAAMAVVGLDDVSRLDSSSLRIAEVVIRPVDGWRCKIPFTLSVDETLLGSHSLSLAAEIRRQSNRPLAKGDFLTTRSFPWDPSERKIELIVSRI